MKHVERLEVFRTMKTGVEVLVGTLFQEQRNVLFQYDDEYLASWHNLSPFKLRWDKMPQVAPWRPHNGLFGVFNDSLPDGWGYLVAHHFFSRKGLDEAKLTPLDRLAFVGDRGIGGLSYRPVSSLSGQLTNTIDSVQELGDKSEQELENLSLDAISYLAHVSSPHGARPKAAVYLNRSDLKTCSLLPKEGYDPYLFKNHHAQRIPRP